ncbi:outer membrane lipoprotein-sorting protein [Candidatus Poribacteria bacterium]|nr:outer membrane lipoprotein-sorting protein [Candidatus Poribacteria bacterium]
MRYFALNICVLFVFIISTFHISANQDMDVKNIVKNVNELYRSKSSYARMEMKIINPNWERTLALEVWTKGMEKTFILINSPKKEKGIATLRIEDEMWNYLPKVNKVMKIPPSMMMGSWMGSDFKNDDLVREFSMVDDYHYKLIELEDSKPDQLYIEFIPKENIPVVWGKIIAAIKRDKYIPVWYKYYDESDKLMRVMNFREVKKMGDREIPVIMEVVPKNKEGHKTVVKYLEAEFNADVDDSIFTLRNLRKKR